MCRLVSVSFFLAQMYGLFMLLQGFMIIPSDFPNWLGWAYYCAFHTYSWRTFMFNEFNGQTFPDAATYGFATGADVLSLYEIEDVNPRNDMLVLILYAAVIHMLSFAWLHLKWIQQKRVMVKSDETLDSEDPSESPDNAGTEPKPSGAFADEEGNVEIVHRRQSALQRFESSFDTNWTKF